MLHIWQEWRASAPKHPFKLARYIVRGESGHSRTGRRRLMRLGPRLRARGPNADQPVILVVHDDWRMTAGLSDILQLENYQAQVASDGLQGVEICQREQIDLVLVNNTMPRMNGLEMIAALRADRATAHIPAIIMTAHSRRDFAPQAYAHGADDILIKPLDPEDLLTIVQDRLRRGRD